MKLVDIVARKVAPGPWEEGDKIPWNEPGFSRRMLREHLSQDHDAASRRAGQIDAQVRWIHEEVLGEIPTEVLDLGCGPGLYTSRLARLGHTCLGIDYGPASIAYAQEEAMREGLACDYLLEDVRTADFGSEHGLAMMIFGEFNTFSPLDARTILTRAHDALLPGGVLLLEPHTFEAVWTEGTEGRTWHTTPAGLFSDDPYLMLEENHWDDAARVSTRRMYHIDAATGEVARHAISMQAYSNDEYRELLESCGFVAVEFFPSLTGEADDAQYGLMAIVARRPGSE